MEHFLFFVFATGLLFSCFFVAFLTNPINAVFFLVLAFCNATGLLLLMEAEFLALLFLIVYVGAIAVLFLFVIIILNLKETFSATAFVLSYKNLFLCIGFCLLFGVQIQYTLSLDFVHYEYHSDFIQPLYNEWVFFYDFFHNIVLFSHMLYTFYFYYILVAGFVLLVAIIGAVVLTSQKKNNYLSRTNQKQFVYNQLARSARNAVFLIKRSN